MKQPLILGLSLLALATAASCSSADEPQPTPTPKADTLQLTDQKVSIEADVQNLDSLELQADSAEAASQPKKAAIVEKNTSTYRAGVYLRWRQNEPVVVKVAFVQNGKAYSAGEVNAQIKQVGTAYKLIYDVNTPAQINLTRPAQIMAAFNVGNLTANASNGQVDVVVNQDRIDTDLTAGRENYRLPMYHEPVTIQSVGRPLFYYVKPRFKLFGSLFRVLVTSEMYDSYVPREVQIDCPALSNNGTMKLSAATASAQPTWTSASTAGGAIARFVNGPGTPGGNTNNRTSSAAFYVWAKSTGRTNQNAKMTVRSYPKTSTAADPANTPQNSGKFARVTDNRIYRLPVRIRSSDGYGDLIITEYHYEGNQGSQGIWELYNPTNHELSLMRTERGTKIHYYLDNIIKNGASQDQHSIPLFKDFSNKLNANNFGKIINVNSSAPNLKPGHYILVVPSNKNWESLVKNRRNIGWVVQYGYQSSKSNTKGTPTAWGAYAMANSRHSVVRRNGDTGSVLDYLDGFFWWSPAGVTNGRVESTEAWGAGNTVKGYQRKPTNNYPQKFWYKANNNVANYVSLPFVWHNANVSDFGNRFDYNAETYVTIDTKTTGAQYRYTVGM